MANIFSFIHYNFPTISLFGYNFNNNKLLDTINPAYFSSFRSFKFPMSY